MLKVSTLIASAMLVITGVTSVLGQAAAAPASISAAAQDGPRPPCDDASPNPPYAQVGAAPAVAVWSNGHAARWARPACIGWAPSDGFKLLIALAGSFRHNGSADDLLVRFGAISATRNLRYWSATDKAWRVLITDAAALEIADARRRRPDYTIVEMKGGADLFYLQEDSRSSIPVVYHMRVVEHTPDRLVIETENVSRIRAYMVTLFPPRTLWATYFLERQAPGIWGFYGLFGTGMSASSLAGGHEASYVNRATAVYRYLIGVPSDQEPPVAP